MSIKYRADIDGLRAISVLSIVLFHADLTVFSGGFVGVDIFFAISGYLITRGIKKDIDLDRFSIVGFYERRFRRIIPGLFAMLAATTLAAMLLSFPAELKDYISSLFGSVFYTSNIVFWTQADYFAPNAEEKPLLHTWSLGVEEQFYIFIPLIMVFIARYAPRHLRTIFALSALISFALSVAITTREPTAAFYLLPTRAWELLLGALAGFGCFPKLRKPAHTELATFAGIALILAAIFLINETMAFPGPWASLPTVGSALVLAYGSESQIATLILANGPARFVGKISYSVYLWHWPLVVFLRLYGYIDDAPVQGIGVSIASIVLGWLSWRYIEQPFRDRSRVSGKQIFVFTGLAMTIAALCGGLLLTTNGWPSRFSPQQLAVVAAHNDFSPMRSRCHITKGTPDPKNACTLGETSPKVALWGDSHGVEISLALAEARGSLQTITYSACPPALDWKAPKRGQCSAHNAATYRYLTTTSAITTVYIAAYYKSHIDVPGFSAGFLKAVRGLVAAGKKVIVIGPTPAERDLNLPAYIARTSQTTIPRTVYEKDQAKPIALMDKARLAGAEVFMPAKVMCDETSCNLSIDEKPVLFDNHHLSMAGARYLVSSM